MVGRSCVDSDPPRPPLGGWLIGAGDLSGLDVVGVDAIATAAHVDGHDLPWARAGVGLHVAVDDLARDQSAEDLALDLLGAHR